MSFVACPSCSCHVRAGERACPHCDAPIVVDSKGNAARTAGAMLLGLALGAGAAGAGCANEIVIVDDGSGGATSTTTKSSSSSTKVSSNASTTVSSSSFNVSSTYGTGPSSSTGPYPCNQIPVCQDDDMDPFNDCVTCSQQMGACQFDAQTCSQNPECNAFVACLSSCPEDDPATMQNEALDCICTSSDGFSCDEPSEPGTCLGDHEAGLQDYISMAYCVWGDGSDPSTGECGSVCF